MSRTVLLPTTIARRLDSFAEQYNERVGVLFYPRSPDTRVIETMMTTGIGSPGRVTDRPEIRHVADEFLSRTPLYGYVDFHTHSKGTMVGFGPEFATNFSAEDMQAIAEHINKDPDYMHLLVTPVTKRLEGLMNPKLVIAEPVNHHVRKSKVVVQALQATANRLGYDPDSLPVAST